MKNKITTVLRAFLVLSLCFAVVGCQSSSQETKQTPTVNTDQKNIRIGCVPASEPGLKLIKENMAEQGYNVEIVMFDGNNLPATALKDVIWMVY